VNAALCRITGYEVQDLVGRAHGLLHSNASDLRAMRSWCRKGPQEESLSGEGFIATKASGGLYAAWTLSSLTDHRGQLTHYVITYRDMTANRQLQEALIHSQRLDAVGRLAGGVAHDFNNLLSVINGYCEILNHSVGENVKAQKEIGEIHQAGQRASLLVRQLLAFGRRQALDPRVIDPNRLVRENADILARLLGDERSLELSIDRHVGNIRVDPTQMQQVLLNLTINARDATQPGGRVSIATERRVVRHGLNRRVTDLAPGPYVVLTVSDNGSGMDEATKSVLFEPFFTTKSEGMGTGLGLALVHGIVNQSRGQINVSSTLGVGSTFEVLLPAVDEEAAPVLGALAPLPVTRGRETLLLVEDDDVVRKMVEGILAADGYDVIAVASPAFALSEVRRLGKALHLVIADCAERSREVERMVRTLDENQAGLRVLCTPNHEGKPMRGFDERRHRVLVKPFALSTLLREVRSFLDSTD
jgi:two-component system, cell cycle sensor histidine kinase and response regulator CckA